VAASVGNITIDCEDAQVVAQFWSAVLGRPLDPVGDSGFASIGIGDASRAQPAWLFERVSEGKAAKNRMHVDLIDPDPRVVEHFVSLGASVIARHELSPGGHSWTVMQDPEGNEFCIGNVSYTG
jgi:predicted enzyme related to lactoylglutathione lyase